MYLNWGNGEIFYIRFLSQPWNTFLVPILSLSTLSSSPRPDPSVPNPNCPQSKLMSVDETDLSWPAEGNSAVLAFYGDSSLPALCGDTVGHIRLGNNSSKWIASFPQMHEWTHVHVLLTYYFGEHQHNIMQHFLHGKHGTLWSSMKLQFAIEISLGC